MLLSFSHLCEQLSNEASWEGREDYFCVNPFLPPEELQSCQPLIIASNLCLSTLPGQFEKGHFGFTASHFSFGFIVSALIWVAHSRQILVAQGLPGLPVLYLWIEQGRWRTRKKGGVLYLQQRVCLLGAKLFVPRCTLNQDLHGFSFLDWKHSNLGPAGACSMMTVGHRAHGRVSECMQDAPLVLSCRMEAQPVLVLCTVPTNTPSGSSFPLWIPSD